MHIDFESEVKEISLQLKPADGYLECEKVIINLIKKYLVNGNTPQDIEPRLKKVLEYLQDMIVINKDTTECINYRYAAGFLKTIIDTPYWYSWIKNIK